MTNDLEANLIDCSPESSESQNNDVTQSNRKITELEGEYTNSLKELSKIHESQEN